VALLDVTGVELYPANNNQHQIKTEDIINRLLTNHKNLFSSGSMTIATPFIMNSLATMDSPTEGNAMSTVVPYVLGEITLEGTRQLVPTFTRTGGVWLDIFEQGLGSDTYLLILHILPSLVNPWNDLPLNIARQYHPSTSHSKGKHHRSVSSSAAGTVAKATGSGPFKKAAAAKPPKMSQKDKQDQILLALEDLYGDSPILQRLRDKTKHNLSLPLPTLVENIHFVYKVARTPWTVFHDAGIPMTTFPRTLLAKFLDRDREWTARSIKLSRWITQLQDLDRPLEELDDATNLGGLDSLANYLDGQDPDGLPDGSDDEWVQSQRKQVAKLQNGLDESASV